MVDEFEESSDLSLRFEGTTQLSLCATVTDYWRQLMAILAIIVTIRMALLLSMVGFFYMASRLPHYVSIDFTTLTQMETMTGRVQLKVHLTCTVDLESYC